MWLAKHAWHVRAADVQPPQHPKVKSESLAPTADLVRHFGPGFRPLTLRNLRHCILDFKSRRRACPQGICLALRPRGDAVVASLGFEPSRGMHINPACQRLMFRNYHGKCGWLAETSVRHLNLQTLHPNAQLFMQLNGS